jgi:hypothetical protein
MANIIKKSATSICLTAALIGSILFSGACFAAIPGQVNYNPDPIAPSYINQPFTPMNKRDPRIQKTYKQNLYFNHKSANPYFNR